MKVWASDITLWLHVLLVNPEMRYVYYTSPEFWRKCRVR